MPTLHSGNTGSNPVRDPNFRSLSMLSAGGLLLIDMSPNGVKIGRAGDEPEIKSAALLVLMATLENATHLKALANTAKHFAFTRCGELNLCGMVDAGIALLEGELLAGHTLIS